MLTAVIHTHESERTLVPTLAQLVAGAADGMLREVIIADAGSKDATADVADVAGCRLMTLPGPLGPRLKTAATTARASVKPFRPARPDQVARSAGQRN